MFFSPSAASYVFISLRIKFATIRFDFFSERGSAKANYRGTRMCQLSSVTHLHLKEREVSG